MEVYDQSKFIEQRNDKIKQIKQDSKNLNEIATDLNDKIYEQDGKLDDLNKELANDVDMVKKANENLADAGARSSTGNRKMMCCILVIFVLVLILAVTAYVAFSKKSDKNSGSRRMLGRTNGDDFESNGIYGLIFR